MHILGEFTCKPQNVILSRMSVEGTVAIGVDVGATKIASAVVNRAGTVVTARQIATRVDQGVEVVIGHIAAEINALAAESTAPISGVGIGVPGLVNPYAGIVLTAVNMGWQNVALREGVQKRLTSNLPVLVENDVRGAARGEFLFGAARGCPDFVLLTIGSGLGSAAMVNGQIIHGANYFASEMGHFVIDPHGEVCTCGLRGCAETVLSGRGLISTTRELLLKRFPSALDPETLTTNGILNAAYVSDPAALAAIEKMGDWLGVVMASASAWLNPARMIIGGGLGNAAFDLLRAPASETYARRVLRGSQTGVQIVRSLVESSAVGAAALAFDQT